MCTVARRAFGSLLLVLTVAMAWGQSKLGGARVEIVNADRWDFDERIPGAQRLVGSVQFRHDGARMFCDSAYLYENNTVKAFGRVRIEQTDTLTITGDRLDYDGNERTATIMGDVRLNDPSMEMTTEHLSYDLRARTAHYTSGAVIIGKREVQTLTSRFGSYQALARRFLFSKDVRVVQPERTIEADTLHYVTTTGVADLHGATRIRQGTTVLYCDRGTYDTKAERGTFTAGGRVVDQGQELRGDTLMYDGKAGISQAFGHVSVRDTTNDMEVHGDRGKHDVRTRRSYVTGRAELVMHLAQDTLFLHADTLFGSSDASGGRQVLARKGVRFFKSDMQGLCDTMVYASADSLIRLHGEPVVWSGTDQITGDTIRIALRDGRAHRLFVHGDAFLAGQVDSTRFDQVAGTRMEGTFQGDQLDRLEVVGNCRTAYFAREQRPDSTYHIIGVNRVDCSRMNVSLDQGQVVGITFITKPDGVLHPLAKATPDALELKGFEWHGGRRPLRREDIFTTPPTAP